MVIDGLKKVAVLAEAALLLTLISAPAVGAPPPPPPAPEVTVMAHDIRVTVDIDKHSIIGTDTLTLRRGSGAVGTGITLLLRKNSSLERVLMDGRVLEYTVEESSSSSPSPPSQPEGVNAIRLTLPANAVGPNRTFELELYFQGTFTDSANAARFIKRGVAYVSDGVVGLDGVFLPSDSYWYPRASMPTPLPHETRTKTDELKYFKAEVNTPSGWTSVSEGDWVARSDDGARAQDQWRTAHPVDGLTLVAGKYVVREKQHNGIETYTFFYDDDAQLSNLYLDKTGEYLDLYGDLFGAYPYSKFAVVESFLPTGYGMPSFTLLGSAVLRLPFIPRTSLGHEVAHSWWGNSVYVDDTEGNWAEALTTYTADHLFAVKESPEKGAEFRFKKLKGYRSFARETDIALSGFRDATTTESRAVGYNKGSMVFKMLEGLLGTKTFNAGLAFFVQKNSFREASWGDIKASFERASGLDLAWFFDQWITRAGAPELALVDARYSEEAGTHRVRFKITQENDGPPYALNLPVHIKTKDNGEIVEPVKLTDASGEFEILLPSAPLSVEVDPHYETFRILSAEEVPPSFSSLFGDRGAVIVLPDAGGPAPATDKYSKIAEGFARDYDLKIVSASEAEGEAYAARSLFLFGNADENPLVKEALDHIGANMTLTLDSFTLNNKTYALDEFVVAVALRDPDMPDRTLCIFASNAPIEQIKAAGARLRYYAQHGYLVFGAEKKLVKGSVSGKRILKHEFLSHQ